MILNLEKITSVRKSNEASEYYFIYNEKYKWSIMQDQGDKEFSIYYYPTGQSLDEIMHESDWQNIDLVYYSTREIKTKEAHESFSELYTLIKEKVYGIDDVFDDIISDSEK